MENFPKFWRKAIKGSVGGRTLNKKGDPDEFLLKGDPTDPDADADNMVVEVFDEDALKYFKRHNKQAVKQGYLIEIADHTINLDETNAVSDGYLKDLLKTPLSKMKSRVERFTSPVPLYRLLELAEADNKPIKTIEYLKSVINKIEGGSFIPQKADMDGVQVTTTNV